MWRHKFFLLIPFSFALASCAKTPGKPGEEVHTILTKSGTVFHDAITVQTLAPRNPPIQTAPVTLVMGNRSVHLDAAPSVLSVNGISLPLDVHMSGPNYEFSKHYVEDVELSTDAASFSPVMINTHLLHRIDVEPPPQVTEIVITGTDPSTLGNNYGMHAAKCNFFRDLNSSKFGLLHSELNEETLDPDLSKSLVAAGFAQKDVQHALDTVRGQFLSMSDRDILLACLASDEGKLRKATDLSQAMREGYLQWRADPLGAVTAQVGGHEIIAFKRRWHNKEKPFSVYFEEFNSDGSEFARGGLSVVDSPTHEEVIDRITALIGETK